MKDSRYVNISHEERAREAHKMRVAFATTIAFLYRKRIREGMSISGIQVMAADAVGFGKKSKLDSCRYRSQRSISSRLMKDETVLTELRRLGLEYDPTRKTWHDTATPSTSAG